MILVLVLVGFLVGVSAASVALLGGGGFIGALLAYSVFGVAAVIATALVVAFAPLRAVRARTAKVASPPWQTTAR